MLLRPSAYTPSSGPRALASLDVYRAAEARGGAGGAGVPRSASTGLLEYETLALRVAPPEISVDNESAAATILRIDSANRPGTLVSVVESLTGWGLDIRKAHISSDGGWFLDGRSGGTGAQAGRERGKVQSALCRLA